MKKFIFGLVGFIIAPYRYINFRKMSDKISSRVDSLNFLAYIIGFFISALIVFFIYFGQNI
ncbi:MAG: hypothetical protein LBV58_00875 [Acholeplasmatales bacterium]|jgi:hypothetical protein|nr:hypothetical protein [Acholeplasmatales bacterium]